MKPGYKTTEFSMAWLMSMVAGAGGAASSDPTVQAASLVAIGMVGLGYQLARGLAKRGVE